MSHVASTREQQADARGRIGNTSVQVGTPTALVVVATWGAKLAHIDLDPGPGVDMPADVVGAVVALLTVAMAWAMNRRHLRA